MQLTRGGEYGLRSVLYLAHQDTGKISMVSTIAEAEDIPPRFLAKIFQMLGKAGVVKSRRGAKGGFSLTRPASEITVKEVIEAIDGPLYLNRGTVSPLRDILDEAQATMVQVLSRANFADLATTEHGATSAGLASDLGAGQREPEFRHPVGVTPMHSA
jgi:Rrf2 family protein